MSEGEMARLLEKAEKGDESAQLEIAKKYALGKGVEEDPAVAEKWFKRFAGSDPQKARDVGDFYKSYAKQPAMAVKWYGKAAKGGDAEALVAIGLIYRHREGGIWDPVKAFANFQKAAELGIPKGHANMGQMYYLGEGRKKNYVLARKHLLLGRKSPANAFLLGRIYRYGEGIASDPPEAFKWFRMAATKQFIFAMFEIGEMYRHGLLGEKDRDVNALAWFLVGSYFEFHKADRAARAMYLRVSPQVVRRAAETAKKIIPQIEVEKDFLEELGILKVPGATPP